MKKICILSAVNIRHMSLISLYTNLFQKMHIEYDIIYMDKYGEDEEFSAKNKYRYENIINPNWSKLYKILHYFKFRHYAIRVLNRNDYDFIVVWNDVAIFMFADYLARKYKHKYCLNIRDYCSQHIRWIYKRFDRVIRDSCFTTISSEGYKSFLPPYNYVVIHSLNPLLFDTIIPRKSLSKDYPIRIGFIGYIRFFDINKKLLLLFKNDPRFELHYYGTHANLLKEYADSNNITNAVFHDTFPIKDTPKYLQKIDIINNLYGNSDISLKSALSIKLYHGVFARIPILVCPNTYMEEIIEQYKIGFVFSEITESYKEELYNWYTNFNFDEFNLQCESFLRKIHTQNSKFENIVKNIISM